MRNPRILNRPMFNPNVSAYGRGIASNLVSEEERQRFNSGGRVGLWKGKDLAMKLPFVKKIVSKFTSKIPKSGATSPLQEANKLFKTPGSTGYGGGWGATEVPWFKSIAGKGAGLYKGVTGKMKRSPLLWGLGGAGALSLPFWGGDKEEIGTDTEADPQWKKLLKKGEAVDTEQLDVEEVADWTPKEKAEKKRDMALMMAERLIGGSRDKWGSKAQMENIAGGLGDIRKITDKEDLRKDERKYRAATKMYKDLAESEFERQTSYEAAIGKGANHQQALAATTGITGTLNRSAEPEQKEKDNEAIFKQGPGTVFFDESSNSWHILTPDGKSVKVTVTEIEEAYKSGALDKMRHPDEKKKRGKKDKLIAETETLDIDTPVTLAGTKPIIDTREPKVNAVGMPFFN